MTKRIKTDLLSGGRSRSSPESDDGSLNVASTKATHVASTNANVVVSTNANIVASTNANDVAFMNASTTTATQSAFRPSNDDFMRFCLGVQSLILWKMRVMILIAMPCFQ